MPVTKSAIKKLRQDRKRESTRALFDRKVKSALKKAQKEKSVIAINLSYSLIDKAVKNHILHSNKAARLKSSLSKLLPKVTAETKTTKTKVIKKKTLPKKAKATPTQTTSA